MPFPIKDLSIQSWLYQSTNTKQLELAMRQTYWRRQLNQQFNQATFQLNRLQWLNNLLDAHQVLEQLIHHAQKVFDSCELIDDTMPPISFQINNQILNRHQKKWADDETRLFTQLFHRLSPTAINQAWSATGYEQLLPYFFDDVVAQHYDNFLMVDWAEIQYAWPAIFKKTLWDWLKADGQPLKKALNQPDFGQSDPQILAALKAFNFKDNHITDLTVLNAFIEFQNLCLLMACQQYHHQLINRTEVKDFLQVFIVLLQHQYLDITTGITIYNANIAEWCSGPPQLYKIHPNYIELGVQKINHPRIHLIQQLQTLESRF